MRKTGSRVLVAWVVVLAAAASLGVSVVAADSSARPCLRFRGVSQAEAEALFAGAVAAVYIEADGEVTLLADGSAYGAGITGVPTAPGFPAADRVRLMERAETLRPVSLSEFVAYAKKAALHASLGKPASRYLVMVPVTVEAPAHLKPAPPPPHRALAAAGTAEVLMSEGFETDFASRWDLLDNSSGQYTWAGTNCSAHSGQYAADAVGGGTSGAAAPCDAPYPNGTSNWLIYKTSLNLQGASEAWADCWAFVQTQVGGDRLSFLFENPNAPNNFSGVRYSGNWQGWWHFNLNLRQMVFLGDLGQASGTRPAFLFESDASDSSGFGARVDDVSVRTGASQGLSCTIGAAPQSGASPLTVSYQASTSGGSGALSYSWSFGDGTSATGQGTSHTFSAAGEYWTRLAVDDSSGNTRSYAYQKITVAPQPSFTAAQSLYFPRLSYLPGAWAEGLGIVNTGAADALLRFTAYAPSGAAIKTTEPSVYAARTQKATNVQEIFGLSQATDGWTLAESDRAGVKGFFLTQRFYNGLAGMDGAGAFDVPATEGVLPRLKTTGGFATEIFVANPGTAAVDVTFTGYDGSGSTGGGTMSVPAKGCLKLDAATIFGGARFDGYVRLQATGGGVIANATVRDGDKSIASSNLIPIGEARPTLYASHVAIIPDVFYTELNLINPADATLSARITPYSEQGAALPAPGPVTVQARQVVTLRDAALGFGNSPGGWLKVETGGVGLLGCLTFGSPTDNHYMSTLPLQAFPATDFYFDQAVNGSVGGVDFFTGIAVVNSGSSPADLAVRVYKSDGTLAGTGTAQLATGAKLVKMLRQISGLEGLPDQASGYVHLTSSQPVLSFVLFGDSALNFLSAVPAHASPPESATGQFTSTTGGTVQTPLGAKLVIPIGAVPTTATGATGTMTFSIEKTTDSIPALPAGETVTSDKYRFGPDGFTLASPVTLTIPVQGDRKQDVVHLYRVDQTLNQAVLVPSVYDPVAGTVTATTARFSPWVAGFGPQTNTADGAFKASNSSFDKWLKICVDQYQLTYPSSYGLPSGWTGSGMWAPIGTIGWASSGAYILPQGTYRLCVEMNTAGTLFNPPGPSSHWFLDNQQVSQAYVYPEHRTSGDITVGNVPTGAIAGPCPCQPTPTPSVGTGQVQITLSWHSSAAVDLDLHVWDPQGNHISWRNTSSPTGGQLDLDNKCGNYLDGRPENIFWSTDAPAGTYTVKVALFGDCGNNIPSMPFEVRVINKGDVQTYTGSVATADDDGTPKQVCTFTVQ